MGDIQTQLPIGITNGTQTVVVTAASALKVDGSAVTQPVSGTVTSVPGAGSFTVVLSGNTNTVVANAGSGTFTVGGAVTLSGNTNTVVANAGSGTFTISGASPVSPGTAPSNSVLSAGQYNTSLPTFTNTQVGALQVNSSGVLLTALTGSSTVTSNAGSGTFTVSVSNTATVVANAGSGTFTMALSGGTNTVVANAGSGTFTISGASSVAPGTAPSNSELIAGQYNTSLPTFTNTQVGAVQVNSNGVLLTALVGSSTVTSNAGSGTFTVGGAVTLSGNTNTVVANAGSGTFTVALSGTGTVVANAGSGTFTISGASPVSPGTAPSNSVLSAGQYNTSLPTFTNTQVGALQVNSSGVLLTALTGSSTVTSNAGSGTFTVGGAVTSNAGTGTFTVSVSNTPAVTLSGSTNTVVANAGTGTFTTVLSGGTNTVVANAGSGTMTVTGTLSTTPGEDTTGNVHQFLQIASVAASGTGTLTYTVPGSVSFYFKTALAASSGGPCKMTVLNGTNTIAVAFYSAAEPTAQVFFTQPVQVTTGTVVSVIVTNNANASQDVYAFINGHTM